MILNVENLTHGFGDRAIFNNVSFRLLAGEHIGLVGANGEGKSTFMNIVTGTLAPDEGKVEWNKHVRVGYLDQHAVLEKGMTIESVLKSAFSYLFEMEEKINQIRIYSGARYEMVKEAKAGMVCAVTGLDHTFAGEGLGLEEESTIPLLYDRCQDGTGSESAGASGTWTGS